MAMNRTRRSQDDDDGMADAELANLQRQYRMADGDRKAYTEESQNQIRKQQAQLAKLVKDSEYLKQEMATLDDPASKRGSAAKVDQKKRDQIEQFKAEIKSNKEEADELSSNIKAIEKDIRTRRLEIAQQSRKKSGTISERQITTLQNRLSTALQKYGKIIAANKKRRDTIDHLKQERKVFETMKKKLNKQVNDIEKKMADAIERSNQAYETRTEAQNKATAIKARNDKEMTQYNSEIKEITRVLEHDLKLKNFMNVKGQPRVQGNMSGTQRNVNLGSQPEATAQTYEQAFAKIKDATGIQEIDKLVEKFIEVEDQNFSLFNLVNELNNEIETLQESIANTKKSIDSFNKEGEAMDKQRKRFLKELEAQLQKTTDRANTQEEKYQRHSQELNKVKELIEEMFEKIGCDRSSLTDMLGNNGINNKNIMQYLGVIEQRTNELLQMQMLLDAHETQNWEKRQAELQEKIDVEGEEIDLSATLGPKPSIRSQLGAGPKAAVTNISILAPSTGDDVDDDDDDEPLPLSHAELKAKIIKDISHQ